MAEFNALLEWMRQVGGDISERAQTPTALKHCVAKVAPKYGDDTSRAFAICTAQLQKSGQLKAGTQKVTAKGKKASKKHAAEPDAGTKLAGYEKLLKKSRKNEDILDRMRFLAGITD